MRTMLVLVTQMLACGRQRLLPLSRPLQRPPLHMVQAAIQQAISRGRFRTAAAAACLHQGMLSLPASTTICWVHPRRITTMTAAIQVGAAPAAVGMAPQTLVQRTPTTTPTRRLRRPAVRHLAARA